MLLQRRANGVDYYYFSLIKNSRCSSLLLKVSRNLHPFSFCAGHWKLLNHFFYFLVTCASYSHSRPFVLKDQKIHQEQQQQQNEMCKSRRFIIFFSSAAAAAAERRLFSRTSWQMDFRVIEWMCRWVEGTRMNRSCRCSCSLSLSLCLSISSVHSLILNRICVWNSDVDLRDGLVSEDLRDRTLRTLVDRFYRRHLDEIFFVLRWVNAA